MEDIKTKNEKELQKELAKNRKDLQEFRFDISGSKIRNTKHGKNLKKQIARILTELNIR
jgi:ribosomal protein L29